MSYLMNNYARQPITFTRGKGCYLFDDKGKKYLDALAGIAVCGLGHAHDELAQTLAEQSQTLWHVSNIFTIAEQEKAAQTLCQLAEMDKAYFCNSGTEANEAAIKLTRLHARARGIAHPVVLTFEGSFHGRTFAAMSATGNANIQAGFSPLLPDFRHLPYNDFAAVEALAEDSDSDNIVAVMLETVQGESGVRPADPAFLRDLRALCDRKNWLLIIDEVQTGVARTGYFMSYQQHGILPDVTTLAKGLGNGIPVGATLARGVAAEYFQAGKHGSTFGGTPLVCAVVNKVLEIYQRDQLAKAALERGQYLRAALEEAFAAHENVEEIRGRGLMVGIELKNPPNDLMARALALGIVINVAHGKVIRLLPPLIIGHEEIDQLVAALKVLLAE